MQCIISLSNYIKRGTVLCLTGLLIVLMIIPSQGARAASTRTVNTLVDGWDGICDTTNCTLNEAFSLSSSGDTVVFDASLSGTITVSTTLYLVGTSLTINGSPNVIISGGNARQVFNIQSGANLTLNGLTIQDGHNDMGGAINVSHSTLNLTYSTIIGSTASYNGGAIYNDSGTVNVTGSALQDNTSNAIGGGAIYNISGTVNVTNSTLQGNYANTGSGNGYGGGIYSDQGTLTVTNSAFENNTAESAGGAIYNLEGTVMVINSTFTGNTATNTSWGNGGGIWNYGPLTVTNSTLQGNSAGQYGGGISNYAALTLTNSTLAENSAVTNQGGGINNGWQMDYANTIIANNTGGDCYTGDGTIGTNTNNLVQDGTCSAGLRDDPKLAALADNGGPTQTMALQADSPAINAGEVSALPQDTYDLDGDGNVTEGLSHDQRGRSRVALGGLDIGAYEIQESNFNWTSAINMPLDLVQPDVYSANMVRYLDQQGQSQWFRFTVQPDSKVLVTLTNLPVNYDLTLYKDIAQSFAELNSSQDLVQLSAEFAPDTFSPDTFSPDTFSPDTFSPDTFSPDTFSPDTFSPDTFSPDTFSPDTFSPDTFSPDTFSPDTFSPDTFSSAQTRSLIAASAHDGIQGEGILVNTWTKSGDFYLRVRGRNGVFDSDYPFHLQITMLTGSCSGIDPILPELDTDTIPADGYHTLIITNLDQTEGTDAEKLTLQSKLAALMDDTDGWTVDVGDYTHVTTASAQAQSNPACVYGMNLQAEAIKDIVDEFRQNNPDLEYIVLVGNDQAIPFFRYPDTALLASEIDYTPPVKDNTTSQASLKSGYILSQDSYGASVEISYKAGMIPIPDLAVGRLVETASDINNLLDAYLGTTGGVVSPTNALVTGYDFLADNANAVSDELQESLGSSAVETLIEPNTVPPKDSWTADDLRSILLASSHDVVYLSGHFSASSTLAADYQTHLMASEVLASSTDFTNSLVYSAGCHSGYNIVNADGVPGVTQEPDWAQMFAEKGATFIGGTGYQYGDTDFIEYSERLYLEFTRQLGYGSDPVPVGKALVAAKQAYLAATPVMRGIHEKALLEATLFGLPMIKFDLPNRHTVQPDASLVTSTTGYLVEPGSSLGLRVADLHVITGLTDPIEVNMATAEAGADGLSAFYLNGPDGVAVNPAEPVQPLDLLNVTTPQPYADYVLRGVGWRGGAYTDLIDCSSIAKCMPLTGAATEDLRTPHTAFYSDVFYPIRPWNINYFDALSNSNGTTRLALMAAQYRSTYPGSLSGTMRRFDDMDFRLYYSGNFEKYYTDANNDAYDNLTNIPALSAPPDISRITSKVNADGTVSIEAIVIGDPTVGIQEAWIVYTYENEAELGSWGPLDLHQDGFDSRVWKCTLNLEGAPATSLRFIVQAVNGVGLVTMMTNQGAYYRAAVDPGALPQGQLPVTLTLESPAARGPYGSQQTFTALVSQEGSPLAGLPVTFSLGGQGRLAVTGNDGRASVDFFLATAPGDYTLEATFNGNDTFSPGVDSSPFEIQPGTSHLTLDPAEQNVSLGASGEFTASLTSAGLPLAGKPVALTLDLDNIRKVTRVAVTDYAGQARWQVPFQDSGVYVVNAWFGSSVSDDLNLGSPFYTGSSSTASLSAVTKTDLHATANDKIITYGDPTPTFDFSFTASDFVSSYGPEDVSGITCSAGDGPFTHTGSPYTITCSGGASTHYNLVYGNGILTVNQRSGLAIQYSGDTYLPAGTTSATLKAQLSGPSVCLNNQTVTFNLDADGNGTYETRLGTQTTGSSGLASYSLAGLKADTITEIEVSVPDGNCNGAVNTGTLMVAGSGDSSNGGGFYNLNGAGRINLGYMLQVKSTKTGTTVTGQILWHVQGKTRLKGTITAFNKACPIGTTTPSGTICGYFTGIGSLYSWNSTTNSWTLTAANVGFQVTEADGGSSTTCTKKVCTTVLKPDYFQMNLPSVVITGESISLIQLNGGNIVVK